MTSDFRHRQGRFNALQDIKDTAQTMPELVVPTEDDPPLRSNALLILNLRGHRLWGSHGINCDNVRITAAPRYHSAMNNSHSSQNAPRLGLHLDLLPLV